MILTTIKYDDISNLNVHLMYKRAVELRIKWLSVSSDVEKLWKSKPDLIPLLRDILHEGNRFAGQIIWRERQYREDVDHSGLRDAFLHDIIKILPYLRMAEYIQQKEIE